MLFADDWEAGVPGIIIGADGMRLDWDQGGVWLRRSSCGK
jgi:hypothetical protein